MQFNSFYPVLMTDRVAATRDFYQQNFGFNVVFDAGWYVSLQREASNDELAILDFTHETVPGTYAALVQGTILNIEVEDVNSAYAHLIEENHLELVMELRDEAFGQRHFMTKDPAGVLIDVIEVIPPDASFLEQYNTDVWNA
ncbi:VOC family protein [Salinicoccus albus]|uniref:VOC family protein n=1 Tax=Salinicoccus albus TaxID=418756 RepID=UPI000372D09A|nr:VOC family protein [Salinicoccus albus]